MDLYDFLGKLMKALWRTVVTDKKIIAHPSERSWRGYHWMNGQDHVFGQRHVFVEANERPLHKIVALTMAVKPPFLLQPARPRKRVMCVPNVTRRGSRPHSVQRNLTNLQEELELPLHLPRNLAHDAKAPQLGV